MTTPTYYAAEGQISTSPITGGIEITAEQYQQALTAMVAGQHVSIAGGFNIQATSPITSIEAAQAQQVATLNAAYAAALAAGVSYLGHAFAANQAGQGAINAALQQTGQPATLTAADGMAVSLTWPQIVALMQGMIAWINTAHAQLVTFLSQVQAAQTVAAVQAVVWTAVPNAITQPLYLTADGSAYTLGSTVNGQSYGGLNSGAIPAWLTDQVWPGKYYVWTNGAWTLDATTQLAGTQALQTGVLRTACQAGITGGFVSSALGAQTNYPSTTTDQSNQRGAMSAGGLLWCEQNGAWALVQHSAAQAAQVVADFTGWLNKCQAQLVTLTATLNATTTVAAAQAVSWINPT